MLDIRCLDQFAQVVQFAINNRCADELLSRLDYLAHYGDEPGTCELYGDFAPHSFTFHMRRADGCPWFSGGLIYQGPGAPGDGSMPSLTVSLDSSTATHKWGVHT